MKHHFNFKCRDIKYKDDMIESGNAKEIESDESPFTTKSI